MEHVLAQQLNAALEGSLPGALLSPLGKRMYFPKGIIAQGSEAKQWAKTCNATIGMAVSKGAPLALPEVSEEIPGLTPQESVAYAPTAGFPALRELWKEQCVKKNPALAGTRISLPVVTAGVTAALACVLDLFFGEGDVLIAASPAWDNYSLIAESRLGGRIASFSTFSGDGFNLQGFEAVLGEEAKNGSVRVILNFPQNPAGYSPTVEEARAICASLKKIAEGGCKCLVICDDSYFGLTYEDNLEKQSLFAYLANLHENIFAVKIDGATKEDFVWGFRCGFITFGGKFLSAEAEDALVKKMMGLIRSAYSCSSSPVQSILARAYKKASLEKSKRAYFDMLHSRYRKARECVESHPNHPALKPLPFNSGYFMSFRCEGVSAEELRQKLLHEDGIGVIAIDERTLRVAFSSIDEADIAAVYNAVYKGAEALARKK